ncbi:DUF423 domain-containing protein [Lacimicrobium alkaliphilum]|uniref:DUF423 domain-containing protein n=1 Tax=Lacimicrobium alkaliphilum TaxID=1526571 RepID=A0ABQ1RCQ6_9ALTE|nr:DUF423 domain-containing protein [Lacimicrobium alkaliphilum]GGD63659.1 DUF423 domain-containing protein [Lacimicrobium alkaliphilum]
MNWILTSGAFLAMTGVMLGAFAAHGLKGRLDESLMSAFQTGVQYQLWHSLALILLVLLYRHQPQPMLQWSAISILVGVVLFSGSLYMLALTGMRFFGPITPLGGLIMIFGWLLLVIASIRSTF